VTQVKLVYLKNVVTLALDREKCTGCGMCVEVCPHGVFVVDHRKAFLSDKDACMECGACAENCPAAAISVQAGVGCAAAVLGSKKNGGDYCCG
jgi:NAD-dependent dihydropyrimidine dehydrogenase PreA subunit